MASGQLPPPTDEKVMGQPRGRAVIAGGLLQPTTMSGIPLLEAARGQRLGGATL
jgi:hypothetical protein